MRDDKNLETFKECGFLHLKGFFSKDFISQTQRQLFSQLYKHLRSIPHGDKKYAHGKLEFLTQAHLHFDQAFNERFEEAGLKELASFLLEEEAEVYTSEVLFKRPQTGFGYRPHQDSTYFSLDKNIGLNFWIPFDSSKEENGAIWYAPGSHRYGELKHHIHGYNDYSCDMSFIKEKGIKPTLLEAEPGDLLLHHMLMVHGSSPNKSSKRRLALSRFYRALSAQPDQGKEILKRKQSLLKGVFK